MQKADVVEVDRDPQRPAAVLELEGGRRVKAPLHHAAIQPALGEAVWVVRDDPEGDAARIVLPLDAILPELHAQGLMRQLDGDDFAALVRATFEDGEAVEGLDTPDILSVLYEHYGLEDEEQELIAEDALDRAVRDRILVFAEAHETPDLVEDAVAALADALLLDVLLLDNADANDVFDALAEAVRTRTDHAYFLPMGVNETAIMIRDSLAPSTLTLFAEAEEGG